MKPITQQRSFITDINICYVSQIPIENMCLVRVILENTYKRRFYRGHKN